MLAGFLLIAGVVYSIRSGSSLIYLPDESEYGILARNLVDLNRYTLDGVRSTAYRPPGYPAVLSILVLLGGDILHFRFLNFIFLSGSIYLLGRIMNQQGFSLAAVFCSLLLFAYPVLFYTAGTLYPQTLASFLFLVILKIYTQLEIRPMDFAVGGVVFGLLVLTVPTFFFAIFVIWGWFWWYGKHRQSRYFLLTLVTAFMIIGFWTMRNYSVFNSFIFVSTNSGENLLIGNSENTTPNAGTTVDISSYSSGAAGLSEPEKDRYFQQQAISYITNHPYASLKLYLQKVLNYFNYRNELVTTSEASQSRDLLMLASYGTLIAIFSIRMLLFKQVKATPVEILFIILYITSALVSAVFFTRIRFRLPFDYLLIMVVAIALERVIRYIFMQKISFSRSPLNES